MTRQALHCLLSLALFLSASIAVADTAPVPSEQRMLYVAVPGIRDELMHGGCGVLVFDIDHDHKFLRRITLRADDAPGHPDAMKGICASAVTKRLYFSTTKSLTCIDLLTDKILWEKKYAGGCDRMSIAPDDGQAPQQQRRVVDFIRIHVDVGMVNVGVYRCCQHNHSMGWPYFAEELWHATADGGLCVSLYSASDVTAKVGTGDSASFVFDDINALNSGETPKSSADESIPRFTWWDHLGTSEWVQYDFKAPTAISSVEVYWFDDTGHGQCRVPQSWRVVYRDGENWKPVEGVTDYPTQANQANRVAFTDVKTTSLRLEVQLQPMFSGGILQWIVK
jgi:hypothetical protein